MPPPPAPVRKGQTPWLQTWLPSDSLGYVPPTTHLPWDKLELSHHPQVWVVVGTRAGAGASVLAGEGFELVLQLLGEVYGWARGWG